MLIWPADLPLPLSEGFGFSLGENRRFTQGDAGPPRAKGTGAKPARQVMMNMVLTRNELARLTLFREDAGNGALPFLVPDYATHGWGLADESGAALMTEDGAALLLDAWFTCLFGTRAPAVSPTGLHWKISFDLLVLPR